MKTETKESGTVEDLKKLQGEIGTGEPGAGEGGPGPGVVDLEDVELEELTVTPQELAAALIGYVNEELKNAGLSPINAVQKLLLRMSIVGFSKKHDIEQYDLKTYPEIGLILSVAWIGVVKVREYRALHPKKPVEQKEAERTVAPDPPDRKPDA